VPHSVLRPSNTSARFLMTCSSGAAPYRLPVTVAAPLIQSVLPTRPSLGEFTPTCGNYFKLSTRSFKLKWNGDKLNRCTVALSRGHFPFKSNSPTSPHALPRSTLWSTQNLQSKSGHFSSAIEDWPETHGPRHRCSDKIRSVLTSRAEYPISRFAALALIVRSRYRSLAASLSPGAAV
jgi:hypothetical protein